MRSVNKIRERDIDPDFLLSLMSDVQSVNVTELLNSYLKKNETLPRSSLPKDYVDEITEALNALTQEISDIKRDYRKKSDPITIDDLDVDLQNIFKAMSYFLQHVKTKDDTTPVIAYSEAGERIIVIVDNSGKEYNVVIPVMYETDDSTSSIDKLKLQSQIDTLSLRISSLTTTINTLKKQLSMIRSGNSWESITGVNIDISNINLDDIANESTQELLKGMSAQSAQIKNLEDTLGKIQGGDDASSLVNITKQVAALESTVGVLSSVNTDKVKYSDLSSDLQKKINDITNLSERMTAVETNKMGVPALSRSGYLYYSAEGDKIIKTRPPVLKAAVCEDAQAVTIEQGNGEPLIINLQTGNGYQYNPASSWYDPIQVAQNPDYESILILNTKTENIEYFILEGTIIKLDSLRNSAELVNSAHITVHKFDITAGATRRVERFNNLRKFPPLVLVNDFETDSRTSGKYINGEGVITTSHDSNGFTLHNDSMYELEVLVMVGD